MDRELFDAIRDGDYEAVTMLITEGKDPNAKDQYSEKTPLRMAFDFNKPKCVKALVECGADVHVKYEHGNTLLHLAARKGKKKIVDILLNNNADPNAQNESKRTPAHIVSERCSPCILKRLVKGGADIFLQDHDCQDVLASQTELGGRYRNIKYLLEEGAQVHHKSVLGCTPLHDAALKCDYEVVDLLIRNGADPNAKNNDGETPILYASTQENSVDTIRLLIECGAYFVGLHDKYGLTALLNATYGNELGLVKLLVAHGADVNEKDEGRHSPLHYAAQGGQDEMIEFLLSSGADVNSRSSYERTPLMLVGKFGDNEKCAKILIERGADVDAKDDESNTPLHYSAEHGRMSIIKVLVDGGAEMNARNKFKKTCAHTAAAYWSDKMLNALEELGADLTATDSAGNTPLDIFKFRKKYGFSKLLRNEKEGKKIELT